MGKEADSGADRVAFVEANQGQSEGATRQLLSATASESALRRDGLHRLFPPHLLLPHPLQVQLPSRGTTW